MRSFACVRSLPSHSSLNSDFTFLHIGIIAAVTYIDGVALESPKLLEPNYFHYQFLYYPNIFDSLMEDPKILSVSLVSVYNITINLISSFSFTYTP